MNVKSLHVVESSEVEDFKVPTNPDMFKNKDINSSVNEARYKRSRVDMNYINAKSTEMFEFC